MTNIINICILGEMGVGKSSLSIQYTQNYFPKELDPYVEDIYSKELKIDGINYQVNLLDTAIQDNYSPLRDAQFKEADGFIIVYSSTSMESFISLSNYVAHIRRVLGFLPPTIMTGNCSDLLGEEQVSAHEGVKLCAEFEISKHFETSAKNDTGVDEAFNHLIRQILKHKEQLSEKEIQQPSQQTSKSDTIDKNQSKDSLNQKKTESDQRISRNFTVGGQLTPVAAQTTPVEKHLKTEESSVNVRESQSSNKKSANLESSGGCCIIA